MKALLRSILAFLATFWLLRVTQAATPDLPPRWHSQDASIIDLAPMRLAAGARVTTSAPPELREAAKGVETALAPGDGLTVQAQRRRTGNNQDDKSYAGLPNIVNFQTNRSDRFLVDIPFVSAGHPFKGRRAIQPHQGAHIHWDNSTNAWPKGGVSVSNYPAIYAVADGYIDRVDYSFKVGTNDRYGVSIAFAKNAATVYAFCYGIEPMIHEPAPGFYRQYILVSQGQRVRKGDIIAYMYLPPGAGIGGHIHFHIQAHNGGAFLAPAIFSGEIVEGFHAHWNGFGRDGDTLMPACMGYLLGADENPFANGAIEVLK